MPSFSIISFSPVSFNIGQENVASTGGKKKNRFRAWIAGWARDLRTFFRIKPAPPPPPDVEIPPAQSPAGKIVTILAEPPTKEKPLSVVASIPSEQRAVMTPEVDMGETLSPAPVYPLILNPLTSPLIQTKVTLPRTIKQSVIPTYRVAEGSHIESQVIEFKRPRNRSKTASTINTLMILLEIESKL